MYGLLSRSQLEETINNVVSKLGGGEPAKKLLMETAAVETDLGAAVDTSWGVGVGIMQFDPIGFDDVKERTSTGLKAQVMMQFGIDIDRSSIGDLRYSPLASVVFARLKYRLVPSVIPDSQVGRAVYWKKWYNSSLGAGTPAKYLKAAARHGLS